ncbi:hypothetical protein NMY22_g8798 [Coprinellus aureogranulatus]|nr:hypothetical protein NMY22_g8798 [Coprinellus aureogranulatus]
MWDGTRVRVPSRSVEKGLCLVHGGKPNTSITVVRPDADFDPHLIHGCASRTSTQIDRSGDYPLTIAFNLHCVIFDQGSVWLVANNTYRDMMAGVIQCSKRWERIYIDLPHPLLLQPFILERDRFPILKSVELFIGAPTLEGDHFLIDLLFRRAAPSNLFVGPLLQSVQLRGHLGSTRHLIKHFAGWDSLTELSVAFPDTGHEETKFTAFHTHQFLGIFPRLVNASFFLHHDQHSHVATPRTVLTHLCLECLSLQGAPVNSSFARFLILPSLTALHLIFNAYEVPHAGSNQLLPDSPESYGEGIMELLRKFGGQLKELSLNPDALSQSSFPSCLELLNQHRLLSLRLSGQRFPSDVPERHQAAVCEDLDHATLVYLRDAAVFPNLNRLNMRIRNSFTETCCESALVEFIAARIKATGVPRYTSRDGSEEHQSSPSNRSPSLRDIHITFLSDSRVDIVRKLKGRGIGLGGGGVGIRVEYPDSFIEFRVLL